MRPLITGATGFIGPRLIAKLLEKGSEPPIVLSRNVSKAEAALRPLTVKAWTWDPTNEQPPAEAFEGVDTVFHLAGDPVGEGRWTSAKKVRLRESRVAGTRNLVKTLQQLPQRPRVLVSASAVGFYSDRGDEVLDESSRPGSDFLAELCQAWEREAEAVRSLGIRVVTVRVGVVLGEGGGALTKMLTPFKLGLGSPLGSGRQYLAWIHLEDIVRLLIFAAENDALLGPLNGTAPSPVTNREFTNALGRALGRPTILPAVPSFMLKLMIGEFGAILLHSQRVIPRVAQSAGFEFRFPEVEGALRDIFHK